MSEKELYDLALSDVPKYSLLNEILAIRDKRFPDEETTNAINVNGYIGLDVLNKYVDVVNNWYELKKWLNYILNELKENDVYDRTSYETGQIIATECILAKMQELEGVEND